MIFFLIFNGVMYFSLALNLSYIKGPSFAVLVITLFKTMENRGFCAKTESGFLRRSRRHTSCQTSLKYPRCSPCRESTFERNEKVLECLKYKIRTFTSCNFLGLGDKLKHISVYEELVMRVSKRSCAFYALALRV